MSSLCPEARSVVTTQSVPAVIHQITASVGMDIVRRRPGSAMAMKTVIN